MRTRDRIISLAALSLMLGLAPVFALDGTPRPSGDVAAPAPVQTPPSPAHSRGGDIPRPPGAIPNAGAAMAVGLPATSLPRPRAPVPVLSTTPSTATAPAIDRPLPPPTAFAAPTIPITPFEAFKSGARAMRDGQKQKGVRSLEYAAEQGVVAAQWKLGRMYAEGDGVDQSDVKAFEYFRRIADSHAEDNPNGPESRYIANAFVSLGHYYREGIAESEVRADRARARQMYSYAASYFRDPDAQYHLARVLLDGAAAADGDARQAARWLYSAANKGQTQAQAVLGRMLFKGEPGVPRQAARGLMWLALARENAPPSDAWIGDLYESAFKQATNDERALAGEYLVRWVNGRHE